MKGFSAHSRHKIEINIADLLFALQFIVKTITQKFNVSFMDENTTRRVLFNQNDIGNFETTAYLSVVFNDLVSTISIFHL